MTEHNDNYDEDTPLNFELVDFKFVSVVHKNDSRLIPTTILLLDDTDAFWREEEVENAYGEALKESPSEKYENFSLPITGVDNYTDNIVTLSIGEGVLSRTYMVNLPVQYVQVARLFDRVWGLPAFYIMSVAEYELYSEDRHHEDAPYYMTDFVLPVSFNKDADEDYERDINTELNRLNFDYDGVETEFLDEKSTAALKDLFPVKVTISLSADEYHQLRAETVSIILGLAQGSTDELSVLYGFAEDLEEAAILMKNKLPLHAGHKHAITMYDFLSKLFTETHPDSLIRGFLSSDEETENLEAFNELMASSDSNLAEIFQSIINEHSGEPSQVEVAEEEPENVPDMEINASSLKEEKHEYLSRPSNKVPLLGKLAELKSEISTDFLYQYDWNKAEYNESEYYQSQGEHLIIMALIVTQRLLMVSKLVQKEDSEEELHENPVVVAILLQVLLNEEETATWITEQSVRRLGTGSSLLFNEFMKFIVTSSRGDLSNIFEGPLGSLFHYFGHKVVREEWSKETLLLTFNEQPTVQRFVSNVFENMSDDDDSTSDEDEDGQPCFVVKAIMSMVQEITTLTDFFPIITEFSEALNNLAELNVMKNTDASKNTPEWTEGMLDYFERFLTS